MAGGLDDMTHDELLAFANSYIATVGGDLASYPGLTAADLTAIGAMRDGYGDSILDADQKREASKAATVTQNTNRKTLLTELRRQRGIWQMHTAWLRTNFRRWVSQRAARRQNRRPRRQSRSRPSTPASVCSTRSILPTRRRRTPSDGRRAWSASRSM
jgi:hypothetical protein